MNHVKLTGVLRRVKKGAENFELWNFTSLIRALTIITATVRSSTIIFYQAQIWKSLKILIQIISCLSNTIHACHTWLNWWNTFHTPEFKFNLNSNSKRKNFYLNFYKEVELKWIGLQRRLKKKNYERLFVKVFECFEKRLDVWRFIYLTDREEQLDRSYFLSSSFFIIICKQDTVEIKS